MIEPTLVNIISVSYSGSTWVNLLLGTHDSAFSVGELMRMVRLGRPVCKMHGETCPIWSRFSDDESVGVVERLREVVDKPVLVFNNPRQTQPQLDASGERQRFIHIVRDGRAVAASMIRKRPEETMISAARHWAKTVRKNEKRLRRRPPDQVMQVKYEDIMADTPTHLEKMCAFIGIDYDPNMMEFWRRDHCFIGGSGGTLHTLAQKRGGPPPKTNLTKRANQSAAEFDTSFYEKADAGSFVDERWKRELDAKQLRWFRWLAGGVNRRLGYAD